MSAKMLTQLHDVGGQDLDLADYEADFWPHFDRISDVFWKLERSQHFREPASPSWVAMSEGDWDRSMRLLGAGQPRNRRHDRQARFERKRVRVTEHPVSRYLQWEMHLLHRRHREGEQIRVLPAAAVRHLERARPLPEVVLLGSEVLYQVRYDSTGTLNGARRIGDPAVIAACRAEISVLYDQAEDLLPYFDREIAGLPAPG